MASFMSSTSTVTSPSVVVRSFIAKHVLKVSAKLQLFLEKERKKRRFIELFGDFFVYLQRDREKCIDYESGKPHLW
jgi:hypothetical protein